MDLHVGPGRPCLTPRRLLVHYHHSEELVLRDCWEEPYSQAAVAAVAGAAADVTVADVAAGKASQHTPALVVAGERRQGRHWGVQSEQREAWKVVDLGQRQKDAGSMTVVAELGRWVRDDRLVLSVAQEG